VDNPTVEHLATLSIRDFVEVIQAACERRRQHDQFANGDFQTKAFALAECLWSRIDQKSDRPDVHLCATVHDSVKGVAWATLSQDGTCQTCRAHVVSVAKTAICPVCHSEIGCT
jgi:hypothetical protein